MCAHGSTSGERTTKLQILHTNCAYSPRAPPRSWVTSCSGKTRTPPPPLAGSSPPPAGAREDDDGHGRDAMPCGGGSATGRGGPEGGSPMPRTLGEPAEAAASGCDAGKGPTPSRSAGEALACCGFDGLASSCRSAAGVAGPPVRGSGVDAAGALGAAVRPPWWFCLSWWFAGNLCLLPRAPPLLLARQPELPLLPQEAPGPLRLPPGGSPSRAGGSRRRSAKPALGAGGSLRWASKPLSRPCSGVGCGEACGRRSDVDWAGVQGSPASTCTLPSALLPPFDLRLIRERWFSSKPLEAAESGDESLQAAPAPLPLRLLPNAVTTSCGLRDCTGSGKSSSLMPSGGVALPSLFRSSPCTSPGASSVRAWDRFSFSFCFFFCFCLRFFSSFIACASTSSMSACAAAAAASASTARVGPSRCTLAPWYSREILGSRGSWSSTSIADCLRYTRRHARDSLGLVRTADGP
mmetsp:Transcript_42202/g.134004  ORF Transcript_42202/g.134004 Transcript_42202/m.134004 type:complete len:465 (+) Transcript_42202:355-1749(+)